MKGQMKEIGGYFSLELTDRGDFPNIRGILVNSGSSALEYALNSINGIKCVWIPYFTCSIVLKPFDRTGIQYKFYHINERLELAEKICLANGEYLLFTNYYGIKDRYIQELAVEYKNHLIVDNAQAFFAEPIEDVPTVYSPRKFFGVPDGGIVCGVVQDTISKIEVDTTSFDKCSHLLKRYDFGASAAYDDFKKNNVAVASSELKHMSNLTYHLLRSIDYEKVKTIRQQNFDILHKALGASNQLNVVIKEKHECPLVYPYKIPNGNKLKSYLIQNKIFCATYWPNVRDWCKPTDTEYQLMENVVCLPIDQRYGNEDMKHIINLIENNYDITR